MKRDIFFSEITPLKFDRAKSPIPPFIEYISMIQMITGILGTFFLMWLESTCRKSPLYFWLSLMIIIIDLHLTLSAIENLLEKLRTEVKQFYIVHTIMISMIISWIIFGHYVTFYQGIECYKNEDFLACCILISFLDIFSFGLLGMILNYYYSII